MPPCSPGGEARCSCNWRMHYCQESSYLRVNMALLLTLRLVLLRISIITINMNSGVYFDYRGFSLDFVSRVRVSNSQHVTTHVYGMNPPKDENWYSCTFSLPHQLKWLQYNGDLWFSISPDIKTICILFLFCKFRMWQVQQIKPYNKSVFERIMH